MHETRSIMTFIFTKIIKDSNILPHPHSLPMTVKKRMSQTQHKLRKAIQENDEPLLISINLSQVRQGEVSGLPCTFHFSNLLTFTFYFNN